MGGSSGVTLEVVSDGDGGSIWSGELCHCLDRGEGQATIGQRKEESVEQISVEGGYPWGECLAG